MHIDTHAYATIYTYTNNTDTNVELLNMYTKRLRKITTETRKKQNGNRNN